MSAAVRSNVIDLGYRPRPWQKEVHAGLVKHRWNVCVVHRRGGKTRMAEVTGVDSALRCMKPHGRYAYIAPYLKQAKQISWLYYKIDSMKIPGTRVSEAELSITFPNQAQVQLFGADNAEAMRGIYLDGAILDEIAQFRPDVYPEIIRPTLADRKGWALFIGTPKGPNAFHDLYEKALRNPAWGAYLYDVNDTKVLDQEELDDAREIMTDAQYRQEFLCDFGASSDNILITIDLVTDAMRRKPPHEAKLAGLERVIGVDVARFGDDQSVIQRRWGPVAFDPIALSAQDNGQVAARVAAINREFKADVIFVDGGRGEGVIDFIRTVHRLTNVVEVHSQHTARNDVHYADRRSEMWDRVRLALEAGLVLPEHRELKRDLCTPTYDFSASKGRFVLESSKSLKANRGRSLDFGSALALTYADDVSPRSENPLDQYDRSRSRHHGAAYVSQYDPLERWQQEAS